MLAQAMTIPFLTRSLERIFSAMTTTYDATTESTSAKIVGHVPVVQHGSLQVPEKTWYKDAGLRSLYKWMPILMLGSPFSCLRGLSWPTSALLALRSEN